MINNQKCSNCQVANICKAKAKLKAFSDEAKINLGVELTFENCKNFVVDNNQENEASEDEED